MARSSWQTGCGSPDDTKDCDDVRLEDASRTNVQGFHRMIGRFNGH